MTSGAFWCFLVRSGGWGGLSQDRDIHKEERAAFCRSECGVCGRALCGQLGVCILVRRGVRAQTQIRATVAWGV